MPVDCRGLALTTANSSAAKHIDQAVRAFLDYRTTASAHVKSALEQDPSFVLAFQPRCGCQYYTPATAVFVPEAAVRRTSPQALLSCFPPLPPASCHYYDALQKH